LSGYTPINLEPLADLTGLHFLGLLQASVQSLKGISALTNLQELHLWNCRNLKSIAALNVLPQLQVLLIQGSRRVQDYARLTDLPAIERLTLDDCADIPSITFLRKLKSLKYIRLGGNTRVMDKNTRPLEAIPFAFYNRRDLRSMWGPR
jgi:Leucine-rich repeat (LRR) protein